MDTLPIFDDAVMAWSEPHLVQTSRGLIAAGALERIVMDAEDSHEWSSAVEYRLDGELVHRSARTHIKAGLVALPEAATL